MDAIIKNPYRVLGVFANSPKREIVANKGKITAFAKVGKKVDFPTDFNAILGVSPDRSLEAVAKAETALTLPQEQLKHALFWFISDSPIDTIAFNHLKAGNTEKALEVWSKVESVSSLQNRAILNLLCNSYESTFKLLLVLYRNYLTDYCTKIGYSVPISTKELQQMFVEVIKKNDVDLESIYKSVDSAWQSILQDSLTQPLFEQIRTDIEEAKKIRSEDDQAQKKAGYKLIRMTLPRLKRLERIIGINDIKYSKLADDLGIQILQCGINYFNNTNDDDDLEHAKAIQGKASSVVLGRLAKERVQENLDVLKKLEKERPPKVIKSEVDNLEAKLVLFATKSTNINNIRPFIDEAQTILREIESKVGTTNEHYQKLSNACVSLALNKNIEAVNNAQEEAVRSTFGLGIFPDEKTKLKNVFREAWLAILDIEDFEMSGNVRSHFDKNKGVLKNLCKQLGVSLRREYKSSQPSRPSQVSQPSRPSQASTQHYEEGTKINKDSSSRNHPLIDWLDENIVFIIFGIIVIITMIFVYSAH